MRFTDYLDEILGRRSDIRILRTLLDHPEKEFTENELADVCEVSQKTVNRAMPKYVDYGLVDVRTVGRANVYSVNSGHYIVKQLNTLFNKEERAREELEKVLKNTFQNDDAILSLSIFGSVARGQEEPTSDIDVFILTRDKESTRQKIEKISEKVMERFGNALSEYILTPEELREKRDSQVIKRITSEGILIIGEHLGEQHFSSKKGKSLN